MADEAKTKTPHTPPPAGGAHHGPGDGPGPAEAVKAFFERLKKTGWFSYKFLGILVFVVVAGLIWRYVASVRSNAAAREWMELDKASNPALLKDIYDKDPNSYAGRTALLYLSRYDLDVGIRGLKTTGLQEFPNEAIPISAAIRTMAESSSQHKLDANGDGKLSKQEFEDLPPNLRLQISPVLSQMLAIDRIEKARQNFKDLSEFFAKDPVQHPECLWGLAKAEEALIGIPKADNPLEHRGLASTAVQYFERVAAAAEGTPLGTKAAEQAAFFRKTENANAILELQSRLYLPTTVNFMPDDDVHKRFRPTSPPVKVEGLPGASDAKPPESKPPEPAPKPPEPAAKPAEPAAKTPEPAAKPPEPAAKTPEPAAKTPEPAPTPAPVPPEKK